MNEPRHEPESMLEQTKHTEHICHNCPLVRAARDGLNDLRLTRILAQELALDTHESVSQVMEAVAQGLEEGGPGRDRIRVAIGSLLAEGLDNFDAEEESYMDYAETLLEGCPGPVSLSTVVRGRLIGVVACGSETRTNGDNLAELVNITRFEVADDEEE